MEEDNTMRHVTRMDKDVLLSFLKCHVIVVYGCAHAAAVIDYQRYSTHEYTKWYYSSEAFKLTYSGNINPIPDPALWPDAEGAPPDPPKKRNFVGRPKKSRKRAADEGLTPSKCFTKRCTSCGVMGHNSRTCKQPAVVTKKKSKTKNKFTEYFEIDLHFINSSSNSSESETETTVNKIPFSSTELSAMKKIFNASDNSAMERIIKSALKDCERKPNPGETKRCVASAKDMIDFAMSVLGCDVALRKTENNKGSKQDILIRSKSTVVK
ncbi:hypothetical protein Dsin_010361 [Dipteronia sinensis]|uniref:BURP domain-containing protein n=1 Tax=Dipteronia sinensis TaxID=43782 RepID=A0AAE0ASE2_9ROSI|nr:hypothetical protein Dsin_010361 [Dipteronia sinensis]